MNVPLLAECPPEHGQEGRREPRRKAEGLVFLTARTSSTPALVISGFLVNLSESGFCASHRPEEISPGREVAFCHAAGLGVAEVVWTRVLAQEVQSAFAILEDTVR